MNFRRVLTALAMVVLFTGIAAAQIQTLPTLVCSASATAQAARSESVVEKTGDLVITCGNLTSVTNVAGPADRANIVVDFGVPITARQAGAQVTVAGTNYGFPSEIMLVYDDPTTLVGPVPAYGQNAAAITVCTGASAVADMLAEIAAGNINAAAACPAFLQNVGGFWVLDSTGVGGGQAINAYQGLVGSGANNTKVTFYNVPVIPSGSGNVVNFWRVVNARVNPGTATNIVAKTTAALPTLATGLPLTGSRYNVTAPETPVVATVTAGLATALTTSGGISTCTSTALNPVTGQARSNVALFNFKENFNGAFKTRVLPLAVPSVANDAQGTGVLQANPSGTYTLAGPITLTSNLSESGVVLPIVIAGGVNAGLANFGTRLTAKFTGLDANATYFVSLNPVVDFQNNGTAPALVGGITDQAWAVALPQAPPVGSNMENQPFAAAAPTAAVGAIPVLQLTRAADGSAQAVWEVTNVSRAGIDNMTFSLYAVFNTAVGIPAIGNTARVQLGYVPTTTSTSTFIPRFLALPTGQAFFNVLPCQTVLMFPFVTNNAGFETGVAISNTSTDPFGSMVSSGNCALNFYGTNQPAAAITVGPVTSGSTYANTVSGIGLTNFQGYMFATCNFQFAHGFAFINDAKQNMAMGYLALVLDSSVNPSTPRGQAMIGEGYRQ